MSLACVLFTRVSHAGEGFGAACTSGVNDNALAAAAATTAPIRREVRDMC